MKQMKVEQVAHSCILHTVPADSANTAVGERQNNRLLK